MVNEPWLYHGDPWLDHGMTTMIEPGTVAIFYRGTPLLTYLDRKYIEP